MNDSNDVLLAVEESFAEVRMHRPVEAIMATERSRRRRHRLSALAVAAVTVGVAVTLTLPAGGRPGTGPSTATDEVHMHQAAFSVDTNPDGTVTVRVKRAEFHDPTALQQALVRAGVPAIVEVGPICRGWNDVRVPAIRDVLPMEPLHVVGVPYPPQSKPRDIVIRPSAMPNGTALLFQFVPGVDRGDPRVGDEPPPPFMIGLVRANSRPTTCAPPTK